MIENFFRMLQIALNAISIRVSIVDTANFLEEDRAQYQYFIKTGNTIKDEDGNFRIGFLGGELVKQRRDAGVWTTLESES